MQVTTPYLLRLLFPQLIWQKKGRNKEIYLTFDDGPHPEITRSVLDILDSYQAKATFFCVGENVSKYPETYAELISRGHTAGNHTYNHLNGWKTPNDSYFENIQKCRDVLPSDLFRPPYGRIKISQLRKLKKEYQIIMWSVLSWDFDKKISKEQCLNNVMYNTKDGAIVVFHDSEKSAENMLYALPRFLEHFSKLGFQFPILP